MTAPAELIMWEGSVRTFTYREQLEATAEAGFDSLALTPAAFRAAIDGLGATGVRHLATEVGINLHLDTVTGWAPIRIPSGADDNLIARFDFSVDECLELVDSLDLRSILAVGVFDHDAIPQDTLVRGFGALCDAALVREIPVNLEFMPFWGVPDLAAAWHILDRAQKPNSGLMLDTWHFAHSGCDLDLLAQIPQDVTVNLQLADGFPASPEADLIELTLHERQLPGEGTLDLESVLNAVHGRGSVGTAGPEVFSDELDTMAAPEAGRALGTSTRRVLGIGAHDR
ncbi:TIM barrel protein [Rhodococcus sp. IEGM 1305]|uniref:sugar phosphate isomerase/epimerase family protein n=1 Tax=Rhodococcus sp. IEGM 1305 TaxID=3047092 RepID=UPI0024B66605|nr:TIM barrel protein [Rhodococcus sp. IEGM 1305]MDI9951936.1 TIM barrel protein [Rhodococcus sp. IEGM 1305]